MSLFAELKQRRIWRVLLAYPGVVFVLLQVIEFFINNYGLDHRFMTATIIASIIMLPAAVLWNWRHGEEGRQHFSGMELSSYALVGIAAMAAVGWYWTATPIDIPPAGKNSGQVRSIAVLPFENASGDSEVQYLCDGIAESLINWLATVPDVKVVSKSAAFRLRDDSDNAASLAQALGVDSLLRGRLEKRGDEIVISATLVDTHDESQLWGERLVQPLARIMYLERSIVNAIKSSLRLTVSDVEPELSVAGGTANHEAYQHYLRGHFLVQSTNSESIQQGLEELRAAISIDPKFALPYADIATSMVQMLLYGMDSSESLKGEARNAAYSAVAMAPDLAEAQTALAAIHQTITFDWLAAEEAYEAAIALSPQSPTPYQHYADFLWATLRFDRALEMAHRGLEIDPMNGNLMHALGISLMYSGDYAEAVNAFTDWNRFYPGSRWSYVKRALALSLNGQCEEAVEPAATAEKLVQGRGSTLFNAWLAWGYQVCDQDEHYGRIKSKLESAWVDNPDSTETGLAFYRLMEGDLNAVIEMLGRTIDLKSPGTMYLQLYMLDTVGKSPAGTLSEDPRMKEMIRKLDFPPTRWSVTD